MVYMAAYEGPEQNEAVVESLKENDSNNEESGESKSFYVVPMSFVIHTYSRVQPHSMLSEPFSRYRHKVTMFKKKSTKPLTEAEQIHDEIDRLVSECECPHKFEVTKVAEGKYRFGDSQKLRLLRILRSTVMVRVGGGWETLKEFLNKNDPCKAEGRTSFDIHNLGGHAMQSFHSKRPGVSGEGSGADLKDSLAPPALGPRKKSGSSLKEDKAGELKKAGSRDGLASPRSSTPTSTRIKKASSHTSVHSDDGKTEVSGTSTTKTTVSKRTSTSTSRVLTPKSSTSRASTPKSTVASRTTTSRIPSPSTTGGASRTTTTTRTSSGGSRSHTTTTKSSSSSSTTSRGSTKTSKTTKK